MWTVIRRSFVATLLALAMSALSGAGEDASAAQVAPREDLLCEHAPAGTVPAVPNPFSLWAVIVCSASGHALVPIEGMVWLAHGTVEPVSVLALPPAATPLPKTRDFDPRYGVRFTALYAAEAKGAKRIRALANLKAALGAEPPQKLDRIFQLDAVSSIYAMRYNIYFYLEAGHPRLALVCVDQCREALAMDILTVEEAKARGARPR
ncbi:hypothetical protein F2P47_05660 [Parvibaculum sedimenti]|uniref:Uncharacterized protein n=1 Tax=Parvibaculum sedimenti TaxID=2608632 RepID=A0A6N6VPE1_9HYPH|nr:hypothetical protein [Parvibaculum sedimenti]KAB7741232.1 hypothetical protein F2P47_05660 [Parvibaculum sedimenti]